MTTTPDLQHIIGALAKACDSLSATAVCDLDPRLAARLVAGTRPFVVVRLHPMCARVFAVTETGDSIAIGEAKGADLPAALDAAVAGFVTRELAGC